jgi:DNA-directed RNA polymerase specialized sigma24 family protein
MDGWLATREPEIDELEDAATTLLKAAGLFRRGTGVRSPRSEREARYRCVRWEERHEREIAALGGAELWEEMDAVAAALRLTPIEKAVLSMARVEEYSLREIAARLGLTFHYARLYLDRALAKCARYEGDWPLSARALFWEEVRQKEAAVYRAPVHSWRTVRR